jgi:hypothetical protein
LLAVLLKTPDFSILTTLAPGQCGISPVYT